MLGPVIEGEKIRLEPSGPEYLPEFIRWFADLRVTRYLLMRCPMTLKQEEEWFENMARDRTTVHWAIVADSGGAPRPIGVTGIHNIDWINRGAITGTIIGVESEWGKGYASEAVALRTAFAFNELNLERLETFSFAPNKGMHKALQRSGYREIGVRRRSMFREGQWFDTVLFELLRDEWKVTRS
jgi:[ribosomal protein S5]-alanine N-acetyltransferase